MILRGRLFGFVLCSLVAAAAARAGDDAHERPVGTQAPLVIPHMAELDLALFAKKRNRRPNNIENHQFLDLVAGLEPVVWPKNTDMRSRIVTPRLRNTPLFGWIAENLYRSKKDNGWCLEVDPGEGEYVVFYRLNL